MKKEKIASEDEDFSYLDTALYLSNCKAHYPISDKYESKYPQENGRWWMDKNNSIVGGQRIHIITYLGSCYKLKGKRKDSMRHVWSKSGFKNAAGLIWLLEALEAENMLYRKLFLLVRMRGNWLENNQSKVMQLKML